MKKRLKIPVRSFGSEGESPSPGELTQWIKNQRGVSADLISFQLEHSLTIQRSVDNPCAGGIYYQERWQECIEGIERQFLIAEPDIEPSWVIDDARRINTIRKHVWIAVPAPSMLNLKDRYFCDNEEYLGALCEIYSRLMREMRDLGIAGHVLFGRKFSEVELTELAGPKTFIFAPDGNKECVRTVLEVQDRIAMPGTQINKFKDIFEDYDIRQLFILDPKPNDFQNAMNFFDPEDIAAAGYCRNECETYWDLLVKNAYFIR
jgi:hypothetical protein